MLQSAVGFVTAADAFATDRRPAMRAGGQSRPGIFQAGAPVGWRDRSGGWRVPLAIMLPASMVVSAGLWAAIAMAMDALL